jgi:predicted O-linked N-acetylglucosamine transferase (SPINDLY family)
MATCALHAIEIPELISQTKEEYEALALKLALHPENLEEIKRKLEKNRMTTALFNPISNVYNIEKELINLLNKVSTAR